MSTKHTPGPWRWGYWKHRRDLKEEGKHGKSFPFWEFSLTGNEDDELVLSACEYGTLERLENLCVRVVLSSMSIGYDGETSVDVSDDDGLLIAAAPELFKDLAAIIAHITRTNLDGFVDIDTLIDRARVSIAKAGPKPNITGTPAKDVVRGERSKEALFYEDPAEGGEG